MSREPNNKETPYTTETATGKVTIHPLHPIEAPERVTDSASDMATSSATNKLQSMKESIAQVDWREQVRERPVAYSIGALSLGLLAGYSIASSGRKKSSRGGSRSYDYFSGLTGGSYAETNYDLPDFEDSAENMTKPGDVTPTSATSAATSSRTTSASQPSTGSSSSTSLTKRASMPTMSAPIQPSSRSQSKKAPKGESMASNLYTKLQGTSFFDRLQTEAEKLGNQVVDEISNLGHNVLLPAVTNKIKEAAGDPAAIRKSAQSSNRPTTSDSSSSATT